MCKCAKIYSFIKFNLVFILPFPTQQFFDDLALMKIYNELLVEEFIFISVYIMIIA